MTDDEADETADYGLEMPFLPVASRGGPHDDGAYVAGYEAGRLDALLASCAATMECPDSLLLHEENADQADLIAMRHGFIAEVRLPRDGWVLTSFTRMEAQP